MDKTGNVTRTSDRMRVNVWNHKNASTSGGKLKLVT
jgi:hypothetical protein